MKLVIFDGYCGFCNKLVDYLLEHDHKRVLKFAPLQGSTVEKMNVVSKEEILDPHSVLLISDDKKIYRRSEAIIRTMAEISSIPKLWLTLLWVPEFVRDTAYQFVAINRYRIFGKRETCRMPLPHEKEYLLP